MGENGYFDMLLDNCHRKAQDYKDLLKEKYGDFVVEKMLIPETKDSFNYKFKVNIKNIQTKGTNKVVNTKVLDLSKELDYDAEFINSFISKGIDFAFDFPGWFGTLDFEKENVKDIMLIQAEPHIEQNDFQITYEFAESNYGKDVFIENNKIKAKHFKTNILTLLSTLILDENSKTEVFEKNNKEELYKFLDKFYITDACHFCPQTSVKNLKLEQKKWDSVRNKVGKRFLESEIDAINPKLIIIGGNDAMNSILNTFEDIQSHKINFKIATEYNLNSKIPSLYYYKNRHYLHLPHIGTRLIYSNKSMMSVVQNEKMNLEIQNLLINEKK